MSNPVLKWIGWAVVLVLLGLIPKVFGIVYINMFVSFVIFAMFAVTLNLLLGYTGLLSFGHALYFGVGAYTTALALRHIGGFPLIPAVLLGGVGAGVFAVMMSPLLVRVSGTAFAMLTLAFGQLMYVFCLKFRNITGGEDGIAGFPIPPLRIPGVFSIEMNIPHNFYYFAMVVLLLSLLAMWFLTKTPFGGLVIGIRDNAMRVDYLGFKVPQTKAVILIVSGFFAGIAGSINALFNNLAAPDGSFSILVSFTPLMMAFIGGAGSFYGPIYGSAILLILEQLTTRYTERVELITGAVFILAVLYAPAGFSGLLQTARQKWLRKAAPSQVATGSTTP